MGYTPENNPYIPGDPYSYDLAWMVQEVKVAQASGTRAAASAEAAAASAEAAADSAETSSYHSLQAELFAEDASESADDAAASAAQVSDVISPMQNQISVLEGRMDAFSTLAEGSTTGDAELMDIRVAADGTVYPTAGDAVRGQVDSINENIDSYLEGTYNPLRMNSVSATYHDVTYERQPDGSYIFNGTCSSDSRFSLMGTASYSDPILPAGTYSFGLTIIDGSATLDSNNDFSIRVGGNGTANITVRANRFSYTDTYAATVSVQLYIKSGSVFTDYHVRFWLNPGDELLPYMPYKTPVDYVARQQAFSPLTDLSTLLIQKYPLLTATAAARGQGGTIMGTDYVWIRQPTTSPGTGDFRYLDYIDGYYHGSDAETSGITDENIGHAQDMCYNPNEDSIYVITYKATGAVAVLDVSSLATYVDTIYPLNENGNTYTSAAIAYNRNTQEYILLQREQGSIPAKLHFYDSSWIRTKTVNLDPWTIGLTTTQGMETDGNYVYITIARKNSESNYTCYVLTYDLNGKLIEETNMIDFSNSDEGIEIEGIAYDWTNGFFLCNCNRHLPTIQQQIYLIAPNNMERHSIGLTSFMLKKWAASESF